MNDRQGDWGLLTIPLAICFALLVLAITFVAFPAPPPAAADEGSCIQAAPVKLSCRP